MITSSNVEGNEIRGPIRVDAALFINEFIDSLSVADDDYIAWPDLEREDLAILLRPIVEPIRGK